MAGESENVSRSVVSDSATLWTVALQAPVSMGFSRQEYWSRLPFPSPENLLDPGVEPRSPALQVVSLAIEPLGKMPAYPIFQSMCAATSVVSDSS